MFNQATMGDLKSPNVCLSKEEIAKYKIAKPKKDLYSHINKKGMAKRSDLHNNRSDLPSNYGGNRAKAQGIQSDDFSKDVKIPESHVFLTTDTGLLKAVNLAKKTATNYYDGAQPVAEEGFVDICSPTARSCFGITTKGVVKYFNNGKFHHLMKTQGCGEPAFIDSLPNFTELKRQKFAELYEPTIDYSSLVTVFKTGQILFRNKKINDIPLIEGEHVNSMKQELHCGCVHKRTVTVAGQNFAPKNYDLATGMGTWHAKNVSHDWLSVKQPIWPRSMIVDKENPEHCFYTATAYGFIRKYDMRVRNKPVLATSMTELGAVRDLDEIFTSISQSHLDKHLIGAGGNRGSLLLLDNRKFPKLEDIEAKQPKIGRNNAAVVRSYKPADGGVLSLHLSSKSGDTPALLSCCGNDRKLRVYDAYKGNVTNTIYLKSKLTRLLFVESHDISLERKRIADVATVKKQASEDTKKAKITAAKTEEDDKLWAELQKAAEDEATSQSKSSEDIKLDRNGKSPEFHKNALGIKNLDKLEKETKFNDILKEKSQD